MSVLGTMSPLDQVRDGGVPEGFASAQVGHVALSAALSCHARQPWLITSIEMYLAELHSLSRIFII